MTTRWRFILKNKHKDKHFLYSLAPLLEALFLRLQKTVRQDPRLVQLVSDDCLIQLIYQTFGQTIQWMVSRTFALEMYSASQRDQLQGDTPEARFQFFIQALQQTDNREAVFQKYPALANIVMGAQRQAQRTLTQFLTRLGKDWLALKRRYFPNNQAWQLDSIESSGDVHRQGQRVMILTFMQQQQSYRLVYKPHSLAIDVACQQFFKWANRYCKDDLWIQDICDRGDYGWCDFVAYLPCRSEAAVRRFYRRMGQLLTVLNLLGGHDIHLENIIAQGEYPVIVDFECFLKPYWRPHPKAMKQQARPLVLNTLMLPSQTMVRDDFAGIDFSALSGRGNQDAPYKSMQWENAGTDQMRIVRLQRQLLEENNRPRLKGRLINPKAYYADFIRGFKSSYLSLLQQRTKLLSANGPLKVFKGAPIRILFRNTSEYGKMLLESYHPKLLFYPAERSIHFDLFREIVSNAPAFKSIVKRELRDLAEDNVPYFSADADDVVIYDSHNKPLPLKLSVSGYACVQAYIKTHFGAEDLKLQLRLIDNSFIAQRLNATSKPLFRIKHVFPKAVRYQNMADLQQQAKQQLQRLLTHIADKQLAHQGGCSFPVIEFQFGSAWNPALSDESLYGGNMGIALTLAWGGELLKQPHYTALAQGCVRSALQVIDARQSAIVEQCGGFSGIAGVIYSGCQLARLWSDSALKKRAVGLLPLLEKGIAKDEIFDVLAGSAGCLVALLSVQDCLPPALLKRYADQCVAHLLEKFPKPAELPAAMTALSAQPLLGLSHGVTGIAWALSQYQAQFPSAAVQQWIQQADRYERRCFSSAHSNWPDYRSDSVVDGRPGWMTAWCHGAAGIGLTKLDRLQYGANKPLLTALKAAIKNTQAQGFDNSLVPCHGNWGNLELLLDTSRLYPELCSPETYQNYLARALRQLAKFDLDPAQSTLSAMPSLMLGLSGIAYQLMRVLAPEQVPSVLLLK